MKNILNKLRKFFTKEIVVTEALDWLFFIILLVPYIWYVLPWVKENIKGEFKIFLFGFSAGILAMIIAKLFVRFFFMPMLKYLKMWYHSGEENNNENNISHE